jgi:hypothetical protein
MTGVPFCECSEFLEKFLRDIGMSQWDGTTLQRCSGELLFSAVGRHPTIQQVIAGNEQEIILRLGSRVMTCDGFTGRTSHHVALGLMTRVVDDYGPSVRSLIGDPLQWPTWGMIQKFARDAVSSWEMELNPRPMDWTTLADHVCTERVLFVAGDPPSNDWRPSESEIQKVKDAIAGMLEKNPSVQAVAKKARMKKERAGIILKLLKESSG